MLEYKSYLAKIDFDNELECFVGEIVNIKDVITFQGNTAKELKAELKNSVDCYLDFCKKKNKDPDKPFSGKLLVRISPDIHRDVHAAAKNSGLSLNKWISLTLQHAATKFGAHPQH